MRTRGAAALSSAASMSASRRSHAKHLRIQFEAERRPPPRGHTPWPPVRPPPRLARAPVEDDEGQSGDTLCWTPWSASMSAPAEGGGELVGCEGGGELGASIHKVRGQQRGIVVCTNRRLCPALKVFVVLLQRFCPASLGGTRGRPTKKIDRTCVRGPLKERVPDNI